MLPHVIVSLVSLIAGAALFAKFGAVAKADLSKLEDSLKAHVIATENRIKADVAKLKTL